MKLWLTNFDVTQRPSAIRSVRVSMLEAGLPDPGLRPLLKLIVRDAELPALLGEGDDDKISAACAKINAGQFATADVDLSLEERTAMSEVSVHSYEQAIILLGTTSNPSVALATAKMLARADGEGSEWEDVADLLLSLLGAIEE